MDCFPWQVIEAQPRTFRGHIQSVLNRSLPSLPSNETIAKRVFRGIMPLARFDVDSDSL